MKKRIQIYVTGNVQRVGFRHQAAEMAVAFDINGKAMYIEDGLLIEAEGNNEQLLRFTEWCKKGPENCTINTFSMKELPLLHYADFEIVHGVVSGDSMVDSIAV